MFRTWPPLLPATDLAAIQLPGRENRYREEPERNLVDAASRIADQLLPELDRPYALYGHSMGALLAFEVARALRRDGAGQPQALIVSAFRAPDVERTGAPRHLLDEHELSTEMRSLGGTPSEILDNEDLMQILLPILRADFELCDTYRFVQEPPLDCPIAVYGGENDDEVNIRDLEGWSRQTTRSCTIQSVPGGHLFILTHKDRFLAEIRRRFETAG